MRTRFCPACMSPMPQVSSCLYCQFRPSEYQPPKTALPLESMVGPYWVGVLLSQSRQAQCYAAYDTQQDKPVLLEEYYPDAIVGRKGTSVVVVSARDNYAHTVDLFEASTQARSLPLEKTLRANNTVYRVYPLRSGDVPREEAEKLLRSPIRFLDHEGQVLYSINGLEIPPLAAKRVYQPAKTKKTTGFIALAVALVLGAGGAAYAYLGRGKPASPVAGDPTATPTVTAAATAAPTSAPTAVTTAAPTGTPTAQPTEAPTTAPTSTPTVKPTSTPAAKPTSTPTAAPTGTPTAEPTSTPTARPTNTPTASPTSTPTAKPTNTPTAEPTSTPTPKPTSTPTAKPTNTPSPTPTMAPTATPTAAPTKAPTATPALKPTQIAAATAAPTEAPVVITKEPLRQLDCDCVTGNDRQKKDGMIKVKWIFYALGLEQDVEDDFGLTPQAWELIENVQRVNGRAPSDRLSDEDYTELFNRAMSQHQLDMFVLGHERSDEQVQAMFHVAGPGKVTAEGLRDTLEVRRMAQMKLYTLSGYYQQIMGEAPESLKDARDVVRCMRQMAIELWEDLHVLGYVEREMPALLVQRDGVPGSALDEALAAFYKDHGAGDGMPYQANDTGFYQVGIDFTLVNELASGQQEGQDGK